MLQNDPPPGAWVAPCGDKLTEFQAQLQGPVGTVYEGGMFKLAIDIPARQVAPLPPNYLELLCSVISISRITLALLALFCYAGTPWRPPKCGSSPPCTTRTSLRRDASAWTS